MALQAIFFFKAVNIYQWNILFLVAGFSVIHFNNKWSVVISILNVFPTINKNILASAIEEN